MFWQCLEGFDESVSSALIIKQQFSRSRVVKIDTFGWSSCLVFAKLNVSPLRAASRCREG